MANRPKQIGTAAETAVVRYCRVNGFGFAERLALHGALDEADVQLCPGVVIEVKGGAAAESASDARITSWLAETEAERLNRGADVAALVTKRKGKGAPNAGQWWAYLPGWTYVQLALSAADALGAQWEPASAYAASVLRALPPVRLTLAQLVELIRRAGWGDPLDVIRA